MEINLLASTPISYPIPALALNTTRVRSVYVIEDSVRLINLRSCFSVRAAAMILREECDSANLVFASVRVSRPEIGKVTSVKFAF